MARKRVPSKTHIRINPNTPRYQELKNSLTERVKLLEKEGVQFYKSFNKALAGNTLSVQKLSSIFRKGYAGLSEFQTKKSKKTHVISSGYDVIRNAILSIPDELQLISGDGSRFTVLYEDTSETKQEALSILDDMYAEYDYEYLNYLESNTSEILNDIQTFMTDTYYDEYMRDGDILLADLSSIPA